MSITPNCCCLGAWVSLRRSIGRCGGRARSAPRAPLTVARAAPPPRPSKPPLHPPCRRAPSYVMVKPDGVQRGLVGEIIGRFERKGFKLRALKMYQTPKEVAEEHYKDLSSKPFYKDLVQYILSGPVVAMVWEGDGVVASARKLIGATNPLASEPGTIRGDFAIQVGRNVIHGSDSPDNGERETALWFKEGLVSWGQTMEPWLKE
ncbi:MAG: nucleoside diphosphate kinase [Monoraphidium minutum]|nr:MAG: nucleoside diphosphate kinase [Monoraphidium minutum]